MRAVRWAATALLIGSVVSLATPAGSWEPKCGTAEAKNRCCWSGTAPFCNSKCPSGYNKTNIESKTANGDLKKCVTGTHALCCPTAFTP